jgi:hypothetical protein
MIGDLDILLFSAWAILTDLLPDADRIRKARKGASRKDHLAQTDI